MMSEKDYKKLLLKAYIEGKEDEPIWALNWKKLPWIGKYRRIKTFLKWYDLNVKNNRDFKLKKINNKLVI